MLNNKKISLILPCRNEEKALVRLLKLVPSYIDEIIVVDNLSTDDTVNVARSQGARVIVEGRMIGGIGYGFALSQGIKSSEGDIIICMDGDGSYPVKKISILLKHLENNNLDFISCNRLPILEPKKMSHLRMFGVKILNFATNILYSFHIKDSLSGMWVFRRSVIDYMSLFEGGWDFSLEIKLAAISNPNINFGEFHISYHDRIFDQSKQNLFRTGLGHLIFLIKYKIINSQKIINFSPRLSLLEN